MPAELLTTLWQKLGFRPNDQQRRRSSTVTDRYFCQRVQGRVRHSR